MIAFLFIGALLIGATEKLAPQYCDVVDTNPHVYECSLK
jgi:hypothetical protein